APRPGAPTWRPGARGRHRGGCPATAPRPWPARSRVEGEGVGLLGWARLCLVSSRVALTQHAVGREDVGMRSSQPLAGPGSEPDTTAGERFTWLAELFDGVTRGHFDRLGVKAGWRCWEVGTGGPSIPEALATAVGPTGYVLATDINPAWLDPHGGDEGLRHDLVGDPPPPPGTVPPVHAPARLVPAPRPAP